MKSNARKKYGRWARRLVPAAWLPLLAGCATAPVSYVGVTESAKETAYECAVAQLNVMGYTIEDGNADVGFVRGRRQTSGLAREILTGQAYHDVLNVTAYADPSTGETNLRVVASQIADQDIGLLGALGDEDPEGGERAVAPSETGMADANDLLDACGAS